MNLAWERPPEYDDPPEVPEMSDPDWLVQARKEGRVLNDTAVNKQELGIAIVSGDVPGGNVSTPDPRLTDGESEKEFQQRVIALAKQLDWKVAFFHKVRVTSPDGRTYWKTPVSEDGVGWPDLFLSRKPRLIAMELKIRPRKTTPEQEDWIDRLLVGGIPTYVFYPDDWSEIVEVLT